MTSPLALATEWGEGVFRSYSKELKESGVKELEGVKTNVWWSGLRQKEEKLVDRKTDFFRHKDKKNIFSVDFSGDIKTKRIYFLLGFQKTQRQIFLDIKT